VSILRYADQIASTPGRFVVPGFVAAVVPALAADHVKTESGEVAAAEAGHTVAVALSITIPIAAATAAVAPLVVAIVYGRGAFDVSAVLPTAIAVSALAPSVIIAVVSAVAGGAHAVRGRTRLLAVLSSIGAAVNLALDLVLGPRFGVAGIGLGTSIALGLTTSGLVVELRRYERVDLGQVSLEGGRSLIASAVAAIPIGLFAWSGIATQPLPVDAALLVILSIAGGLVYLAVSRALGATAPFEVLSALRSIR
jgi:putative peptidoglycan lipid II flippase